jgi:hypothetical protein
MDELKTYLEGHGIANPKITKVAPDIEDMFMRLMEREESHG